MSSKSKLVHFHTTRFSQLAMRGGAGVIGLALAVKHAKESLQSMRGEADAKIVKSITAIETIVVEWKKPTLGDNQLQAILRYADEIVTLSGTYGYDALDLATRSLCDLADGFLRTGRGAVAPISIHLMTMCLLAPGAVEPSPEERAHLFAELAKVRRHFNIEAIDCADTADNLNNTPN